MCRATIRFARQPDLVIFLHVPIEISQRLIDKRQDKNYLEGAHKDIYERDLAFQRDVLATYLEIAEKRKNWLVIDCVEDDQLLSIETIHHRIIDIVTGYFDLG